jgi:hypothetical protein
MRYPASNGIYASMDKGFADASSLRGLIAGEFLVNRDLTEGFLARSGLDAVEYQDKMPSRWRLSSCMQVLIRMLHS